MSSVRFNYDKSGYTWHRFGLAQLNSDRSAPRRNWQTSHMVGKVGAEVNSLRRGLPQNLVRIEHAPRSRNAAFKPTAKDGAEFARKSLGVGWFPASARQDQRWSEAAVRR